MILLSASTVNAREMNKAKISSVDLDNINDQKQLKINSQTLQTRSLRGSEKKFKVSGV